MDNYENNFDDKTYHKPQSSTYTNTVIYGKPARKLATKTEQEKKEFWEKHKQLRD